MTISEEIIIIGRNEAKQVFEELARDAKKATEDVGKGSKDASGGLKDMGKSANELVKGLTGMNIASLAGVGGIIALADGVKVAVSETMDYEDEIRRLSLLTGQNLGVTTQMDSLFNRFGITGGQLNMVMRTLSKEGIDPNIVSIEKLSAEFQKLETPAERDAFLIKNFGRAGLDLGIMLSQGPAQLQAYADATNSMLVPTQKQMDAELKLKMATFDLGEGVKALKIRIGNEFIPAVLDAVNAINYLTGAMDKDTKKTYEHRLERDKLEHLYRNHAISAYAYAAGVEELVRREEAAKTATKDLASATDGLGEGVLVAHYHVAAYSDEIDNAKNATESFAEKSARIKEVMAAFEGLRGAQESYTQAAANFSKGEANDLVSALDKAGVKGKNLEDALAATDQILGTNTKSQHDMQQAVKDAADQYAQTGNLEDYKKKIGEIRDTFQPFDDAVEAAKGKLKDYRDELDRLANKHVDVYLTTHYLTTNSSTPTDTTAPEPTHGPRAQGGPVRAGQAYLVGERGPETFVPNQNGTIVPNGAAGVVIESGAIQVNGAGDPQRVAELVINELSRRVQAARRGGAGMFGG